MIWILIVIAVGLLFLLYYVYKQVFLARRETLSDSWERLNKYHFYTVEQYEKLPLMKEEVISCDNYKLYGYFLGNDESDKLIVLIHGYTGNHLINLKFLKIYQDLGFNILMIDTRSHGESEGKMPTYGVLETEDVKLWIDHIKQKYHKDFVFGLHGQSMGGATVLMYGKKYQDAAFIVSDCPYSDLREELYYQFKKAHVPQKFVFELLNLYTKHIKKLDLSQISPIKDIEKMKIPTLFIHGTNDTLIPCEMSQKMYHQKSHDEDELLLVEGAEHVDSHNKDQVLYEETVRRFVSKWG